MENGGAMLDLVLCRKSCAGNNTIVTADSSGAVSVWEIEDTLGDSEPTQWFSKDQKVNGRNRLKVLRRGSETDLQLGRKDQGYGKGPIQLRLLRTWKCHVDGFAALEVCETYGLIATGGRDCSVRVWDMQGQWWAQFYSKLLNLLPQHTVITWIGGFQGNI